jgi:signal transduction histidine kinase/ActR/RegA family two-component response regulator
VVVAQWQGRLRHHIARMTVRVIDELDSLLQALAVELDLAQVGKVRAERALLAEQEAQVRAAAMRSVLLDAMDGMSHGLIVLDDRNRIVGANPRFAQLLQLPDDLMSRQPTLSELMAFLTLRGDLTEGFGGVAPSSGEKIRRAIIGQAEQPAYPYVRRDRNGRYLEFASFRSTQGLRVLTVSDVTEHRELASQLALALADREKELEHARLARQLAEETALQRDEAQQSLQLGMQLMSHGVMVRDSQGWIQFWNARLIELLDLPADFFSQRRSVYEIVQLQLERGDFGLDGEAVRQTLGQHLSPTGPPGDPAVSPFTCPQTREGRISCIQVSRDTARSVHETQGARFIRRESVALPSGACVTVYSDITSLVTSRNDLQHSLTQLQQADAERRAELSRTREAVSVQARFVAAVSHELRTPLNGIAGMAELLADSVTGEQAGLVRDLQTSVRQLRRLADELLDLSRASTPGFALESVAFDLFQPLQACAGAARVAIGQRPVTVRLALDGESLMVMGDPLRLSQVVNNLLANALKFTEQGEVSLRAAVVSAPTESEGIELRLTVADTGSGIDPAYHEVIFEPFHQGPGSTNRTHGGTGLGLALCRQIVQAMDGSIEVESQIGAGSRFNVRVPFKLAVTGEQAAEGQGTPEESGWRLDGARILVADDNRVNQKLMRIWLTAAGADVTAVHDGRAAVLEAEAGRFDAILMDVAMPVMTGLEATRILRDRERAMRSRGEPTLIVPILGVTAMARAEDRQACLDVGMTSHLSKPVDRANLLRTLRDALDGRRWSRGFLEVFDEPAADFGD